MVNNCINITIIYPLTSSLFYTSTFYNTSKMMDVNQHRLNCEYFIMYNTSCYNLIYFALYIYLPVT